MRQCWAGWRAFLDEAIRFSSRLSRYMAMLVQQGLAEDPFSGALYAFRGRRAGLIKLLWHDGIGLCLLTKKLEQGQFVWPSTTSTGRIALTPSQLTALLEGPQEYPLW